MEQIAEKITEGFIQELPEQSNFFSSEDLLSSGIPIFVVNTLEKTVASKIGANMNLPQTEWVQTDSSKVQAAWLNFVDVSKEHVKIPSAKVHDLLLNAVERCLKLALKPRQSVPEFIFKKPDEIDLEVLKRRVSNLYVNRPLGVAMLRYMEKKGLKKLELEEARDIVKKIDQKLCEKYHPLNWAQVLKPVFQMAGPSVDSDLFRIFFQDKGKHNIARKFDLLDREISETEFIEIMSSAELLNVEGYEETQPHLFSQAMEEKIESPAALSIEEDETVTEDFTDEKGPVAEKESAEEPPEIMVGDEEEAIKSPTLQAKAEKVDEVDEADEADEAEQDDELETEEENIAGLFTGIKSGREIDEDLFVDTDESESELSIVEPEEEPDDDEGSVTLLNKFMFDDGESDEFNDEEVEEKEDEEESREKRESTSIYEEMDLVQENRNRAERMADPFEEDESEEETDKDESEPYEELSYKIIEREGEVPEESKQEEIQPEEDEDIEESDEEEKDEDELPMWRSFLERADIETESGYEYDEDSEEEIEDNEGFIEEPLYDLTATEEDPQEKIKDVSRCLEDEKNRFVKEIFRNSEMAYEQALIEIMDFNDWKSASHYLEREVFSRNRIDVYDETAVDFTDRLHSYFMENKS